MVQEYKSVTSWEENVHFHFLLDNIFTLTCLLSPVFCFFILFSSNQIKEKNGFNMVRPKAIHLIGQE